MPKSSDIARRFWSLPQKAGSGKVLRNPMQNEALKREFLDICYHYDCQPWASGLGKDNLIALAEVRKAKMEGRQL